MEEKEKLHVIVIIILDILYTYTHTHSFIHTLFHCGKKTGSSLPSRLERVLQYAFFPLFFFFFFFQANMKDRQQQIFDKEKLMLEDRGNV